MFNDRYIVLFVEGATLNGCVWYRIRQPYQKLTKHNVFLAASTRDLAVDDVPVWLDKADVIVSQCHVGEKFLEYMIEEKGKRKFVIDMDDNPFEVSPFNPAYERNGLKEVDIELPDGRKYEIRDGKAGFYSGQPFNLKDNQRRMALVRETIASADLITTPSPVLSGIFKGINPKVKIVKNFLDMKAWSPLNIVKDGFIRIGWQGGYSHYPDFFEVKEVLEELMAKYSNLKIVVMGEFFKGIFSNMPEDRIETHGWVGIETYPWKFKALNIDIGIAPIENNVFNTCKSELKWTEYATLGIPCVASNIPPYSLNIRDGDTGFLAQDAKEWKNTLTNLIESKELRTRIGQRAQEHVLQHYDADKNYVQYESAYKSLFKPELILKDQEGRVADLRVVV